MFNGVSAGFAAGATVVVVVVVGATVVVVVVVGAWVVVVVVVVVVEVGHESAVGQSQRCPPWFQTNPEAQFCNTGFPLMHQ